MKYDIEKMLSEIKTLPRRYNLSYVQLQSWKENPEPQDAFENELGKEIEARKTWNTTTGPKSTQIRTCINAVRGLRTANKTRSEKWGQKSGRD